MPRSRHPAFGSGVRARAELWRLPEAAVILGWIGVAQAWDPGAAVAIGGPAVDAVPLSGGIVATGPQGTAWIGADGGSTRLGEAAAALVAVDLTGDHVADLVVCGPSGVSWWASTADGLRPGGVITAVACRALAVGGGGEAPSLVIAGDDGVSARVIDRFGVGGPRAIGPAVADPIVAAVGDRVAIASRGGSSVTETSDRGSSTFAADAPIGGIAVSGGRFVWTSGAELADAAHRTIPIAPLAGAVAAVDGVDGLVVLHGVDRLGVISGGAERITPLPFPVAVLRAGDVDGDGCVDVVAAGSGGVALVRGTCAAPVVATAPPDVTPGPIATPDADHPAPRMPRPMRLDACTAMAGVAGGASYAPSSWTNVGRSTLLPSVSPALALACEMGRGGFRLFGGVDSAVTFRYLAGGTSGAESRGSHILAASAGFLFGGERFAVGPVATAGIAIVGAGARVVWLPFGRRDDQIPHGFELRALALGPAAGPVPSAEIMLMYGFELREFR